MSSLSKHNLLVLAKGAAEIVDEIVDVFDADAEAHEGGVNRNGTGGGAGVSHAIGMLDEAFDTAKTLSKRE